MGVLVMQKTKDALKPVSMSESKTGKVTPKKPTKTYQYLAPEVKEFIVKAWAQYSTVEEIQRAVKEEFDLTIETHQSLYRYNPDRPLGSTLSGPLRELFNRTRREFTEELNQLPGMVRAVRVQRLDNIYHAAIKKGDHKTAVAALNALRREMDAFELDDGEEKW